MIIPKRMSNEESKLIAAVISAERNKAIADAILANAKKRLSKHKIKKLFDFTNERYPKTMAHLKGKG